MSTIKISQTGNLPARPHLELEADRPKRVCVCVCGVFGEGTKLSTLRERGPANSLLTIKYRRAAATPLVSVATTMVPTLK